MKKIIITFLVVLVFNSTAFTQTKNDAKDAQDAFLSLRNTLSKNYSLALDKYEDACAAFEVQQKRYKDNQNNFNAGDKAALKSVINLGIKQIYFDWADQKYDAYKNFSEGDKLYYKSVKDYDKGNFKDAFNNADEGQTKLTNSGTYVNYMNDVTKSISFRANYLKSEMDRILGQ